MSRLILQIPFPPPLLNVSLILNDFAAPWADEVSYDNGEDIEYEEESYALMQEYKMRTKSSKNVEMSSVVINGQ